VRILVVPAVLVLAACGAPSPSTDGSFNLVILSIDTLRPDHLGCYGYHRNTSPNLDLLARRSAVFDQAVTVHVTTAPAHGSILTGRYPGGHGILRNGMRLTEGVPTLADHLGDRGWATGGFVSGWTLQRHTGLDRGFSIYDDRLGEPRYGAGARRAGIATTGAALAWLENRIRADERFFLFLHVFEPHWPYEPPAEDALQFLPGQSELTTLGKPLNLARLLELNRLSEPEQAEFTARYDGEILVADRLLGHLLGLLETMDAVGNTVLIVLSDHGETLFEREWTMDHGARPYEEQVRVPLILHIPGDRSAGRRVPDQVSLIDITPTVLDILGIEPPEGVQGRSLLPLARGEAADPSPRPAFITARTEPQRLPRVTEPLAKGALARAIRLPGIKLVEYPTTERRWHPELYSLVDDPGETEDLVDAMFDTAASLHRELERWQTTSGIDPFTPAPQLEPDVEAALRVLGYIDD
jgi:arylsulfatase A-like enzyme